MGIGTGCEVVAEVLIETAANPATPWYLCAYSGANPVVCATSASYTELLENRAFKELNKEAAKYGCKVAVQAAEKVYRIAIVKGAETARDVNRGLIKARKSYNAINSYVGMRQLMHALRFR